MSIAQSGQLNPRRVVLWYGPLPGVGVSERLAQRGIRIDALDGPAVVVSQGQLAEASGVVFDHTTDGGDREFTGYKNIKEFINHGLRIIVVCDPAKKETITQKYFKPHDGAYPWSDAVTFVPNFKVARFDYLALLPPRPPWKSGNYFLSSRDEGLKEEEQILLGRVFPMATMLKLKQIAPGYSGARVFMVHEKRLHSSLSHWTQPKLVKVGPRVDLLLEVDAMKQVSRYVPFELRPNYENHADGLTKALYVADFVDQSEPLLTVAHDGRAEPALSNLFFRTLGVWRDCALERTLSHGALAETAELLGMFKVEWIRPEYRESIDFTERKFDLEGLWAKAKKIQFGHRVATIHGDLHGKNIRVRGQDAIIIDLGQIKGTDLRGAPLCFDVAMLDVALGFQCPDEAGQSADSRFFNSQPEWTQEIESYYTFKSLLNGPPKEDKYLGRWLHGCLQRIRAFATYSKSEPLEYPIAVAIAMWRWCKFPPDHEQDKGRRVKALILGAAILEEAIKHREESEAIKHEESQKGTQ